MTGIDLADYAFAHRGLWGGDVPENSLSAFRAAAAAGLGCELDVRVAKDGELVVFHDATLQRLCGDPSRVDMLSLLQLRRHKLPDGSLIPTLHEALEAMGGLPSLIEIKVELPQRDILVRVIEFLQASASPSPVMSFDEFTVWRLAAMFPNRLIGQLIEPLSEIGREGAAAKARRGLSAGCGFLAPHQSALGVLAEMAPLVPLATWTVRTPAELEIARKHGAAPIFEGFGLSPLAGLAKPSQTPI